MRNGSVGQCWSVRPLAGVGGATWFGAPLFVSVQTMKAILLHVLLMCILCSGCNAQSPTENVTSDTQNADSSLPSGSIQPDNENGEPVQTDEAQASKTEARPLPEVMKAGGFPLYGLQVSKFIQSSLKSTTGRLPERYSAVGAVKLWQRESPKGDLAVFCMVPFRLYADREVSKTEGAYRCTVNRCRFNQFAILNGNDRLVPCTYQQAQTSLKAGRDVYYHEDSRSYVLFWNPDDDRLKPQADRPKIDGTSLRGFTIEYEFDLLSYQSPLVWQDAVGYYRHGALVESRWDSDHVVSWNQTGALTGMTPDYFRPEESSESPVVSARLLSAVLKSPDGDVVATYRTEAIGKASNR